MQWLNWGTTQKSPATIHQWRSSVTDYARWAGIGGRDFLHQWRAPKLAPPNPHPIPEGMVAIDLLLGVCVEFEEKALIALCGLMGLRVNEAVTTPASAVDMYALGGPVLHVVGKGAKPRDLPIPEKAITYVLPMALIRQFGGVPLVRIERDRARKRVTALGSLANLSRPISSHDLRATFATDMYERTLDVVAVQEWMGHSAISTTMRYIGTSMERKRAAVA